MLIDLDDARAQDPGVVGAKAAGLARARRACLPVLPGLVVPVEVARPAVAAASAALAAGGSGAARLAVMEVDVSPEVVTALERDTQRLGYPLVVRSSSPLEDGGVWAGAFSSFHDVEPADLRTAVRGVWTSAFTVHALERCEAAGSKPDELELAVLLQPQVEPVCAGSAHVLADGGVDVHATRGSARDLMEGWVVGVRAHVAADGNVEAGPEALELGETALTAAATLALHVHDRLGDNLVEWAWTGEEILLLQSSQLREPARRAASPPPQLRDAIALRVARLAVRFPGPLGEELVLPWAVGLPHLPSPSCDGTEGAEDAAACLRRAAALAAELTKVAWQERSERAQRRAVATFRGLRGPDPASGLRTLAHVRAVDPARGARVLELVERAATTLVQHGRLTDARQIWTHTLSALRTLGDADQRHGPTGGRIGPSQWEPFVHAAVQAHGRSAHGVPVVAGIGAGPVVVVRNPHDPPPIPNRAVVVVDRPLPALASLLWSASALVASSGNPAAHLMEVASALGTPTVLGLDLTPFGGLSGLATGTWLGAVDGRGGTAAFVAA